MEKKCTVNRFQEMEDLMHSKVDLIADYINNGKISCAMIELGALNEYIHLQSTMAMETIPNNML